MSTQNSSSTTASNPNSQSSGSNVNANPTSLPSSSRRKTRPTKEETQWHIREKTTETKYTFTECDQRNIAIIGRTRSGKTTFANVIRDLKHIPDLLELYSGTRKIDIRHIAAQLAQRNSNIMYSINIIDTPGFYDTGNRSSEKGVVKITNENIKILLDECMTKEVTKIHLFAFVFSVENGINSEDVESMKFVQEKYPQLKPFLMLILTHCEDKDEDARKNLIEEFFKDERVKRHNLREYFGLGFYFMGCINPQHVKAGLRDSVDFEVENVEEMRETFLDFLAQRKQFFNIHDASSGCSIL